MPRINLLPWREAERKRKRQEFGVGAVGALILAGVIALAVNWQMGAAVDAQIERNQYLKNQMGLKDNTILQLLEGDAIKNKIFDYEQNLRNVLYSTWI